MRLRDYPGISEWPPLPGGAYTNEEFPTDEGSVILNEVFPVVNEFVTFTCEFKGRLHSYDLMTADQGTAEELARWMKKYIGKRLSEFGNFPLDH